MGAPKLYTKKDLLKLKDSKPVPITAHSHEVIVPVVYADMVNKYLESKGVKLPLSHHQLAEMKREAHAIGGTLEKGYAIGSRGLGSHVFNYLNNIVDGKYIWNGIKWVLAKFKQHGFAKGTKNLQVQQANQKVIIHIGDKKSKKKKRTKKKVPGITPTPTPSFGLYETLRPNNYASIRPLVSSSYVPPPIIPDYKREAEEHLKREREAFERYRKELEDRDDALKDLRMKVKEIELDKSPLYRDPSTIPVRWWERTPEQPGSPQSYYDSSASTPEPLLRHVKSRQLHRPIHRDLDLSTP